jgi:hypothetical protein
MDAKDYMESIKIETKEEYNEYQQLLYNTVENGLKNDLTTINFQWKDTKTEIDLNSINFLVGYNYAVVKTLVDLEQEKNSEKSSSATK